MVVMKRKSETFVRAPARISEGPPSLPTPRLGLVAYVVGLHLEMLTSRVASISGFRGVVRRGTSRDNSGGRDWVAKAERAITCTSCDLPHHSLRPNRSGIIGSRHNSLKLPLSIVIASALFSFRFGFIIQLVGKLAVQYAKLLLDTTKHPKQQVQAALRTPKSMLASSEHHSIEEKHV